MRGLTITERLRLGLGLVTTGRFLSRTPFWPARRLREWQLDRVRAMVVHAYENVPFYRRHYDAARVKPSDLKTLEDLSRFPLVTKEDIIANYPDQTLANGHRLGDLIVSRSSGSSGKVLDIAYDSRAMLVYVLAGLRMYSMGFRYRPWHRQTYIYTSPYPVRSLFGLFPTHFIHTLTPIGQTLKELAAHPPDLLVCYPSHLKQIVAAARLQNLSIRPRMVSVNSEMSTGAERAALSHALGCPVLDEYSSEELTRIAAQCLHGNYHLFEDINYIETIDNSGHPTVGPGLIVGTNLYNTAMPMIRYVQNDIGEVRPLPCACGRKFRHLVGLQGRKNDAFTLPSGRVLSSGFLLDATYGMLLDFRDAVSDFCLVQERPDSVLLQVVAGPSWNNVAAIDAEKRFNSFLEPGVAFRIEIVTECTKTASGKRNPIINLVTRQAPAPDARSNDPVEGVAVSKRGVERRLCEATPPENGAKESSSL